jgi:signal transduction histidine kinase
LHRGNTIGRLIRRGAIRAACLASTAIMTSAAAFAQVTNGLMSDVVPGTVFVLGIAATLGLAFSRIRTYRIRETEARGRISQLEFLLNEAEVAQHAEAHILLTWRDRNELPDRMSGNMHGSINMPTALADIMNFSGWLEPDSVNMLRDGLVALKDQGRAFNIGIRTTQGELLEADGRAAGALAALRFRPLSGQRREVTELAYDARKLSKQVERLSALLDAAPFPVWISDAEDVMQWVNQAYLKASELPDVETILRNGFALIKPGDIDTSKANPSQGLSGRAHAIQHGTRRSFNIHDITLDQGKASFAIDVTDLEGMEKELDRHVKAHAATLDKLTTALAIFGADQRLKFFNQAYVALWGLSVEWLKTEPTDGEILEKLRSDRLLPEQTNFREWKSKLLQAYSALETTESFWYLPDGRSLSVITERHPFGGVTYHYDNLTREHQLESQYNELFEVQHETLDNLAEAVALFGSDGRIKLFNPAFEKFWDLDPEFLGKKPTLDDIAAAAKLDQDAQLAWGEMRYAITAIDAQRKSIDGKVNQDDRILRYRSVPLPDGNSLVTFTDISDAARAEQALRDRTEALEAADRLKSSFLAHVSYEIRTPLTSIVGYAESLSYGLAGPLTEKQTDYVGNIRNSSEELKTIIDAIIDLSAIDAGALELKLQDVDVAYLLETAVQKVVPGLTRRNLAVEIEIASDIESFICDPTRMDQVLGHLLSNAAGFSPNGSTIKLGARRVGEGIQLWVADTGKGIEPEFQEKVFDRFQAKPLPGSHRGPGLGLALVKSFTELHGGRVSLVSKINQGTTVVCTLPISGPKKSSELRTRRSDRRAA